MDKVKIVKDAKRVLGERLSAAPEFDLFQSIDIQLDYLLQILQGFSDNRDKLKEINVGVLAVREFEESDPDLARALKKVQYVVYKMTGGVG